MATDKNGIKKAWSDLSVKVKILVGGIVIITAFLTVHPYLPYSLSLGAAIAAESTEREQGDLETQLDILDLQIQFYI